MIGSWQMKEGLVRRLIYWELVYLYCVARDTGSVMISLQWVADMKADLQFAAEYDSTAETGR